MSLLSRAWNSLTSGFHKASDSFPSILANLRSILAHFDLTPAHINAIKDEVIAVEKAYSGKASGFEKADKVATAVGNLTGDLKLPDATNGFLGTVITSVHAIVTIEQLIAAAKTK